METAILIPSLSPTNVLLTLVNDLIKVGFKDIIIVNDGSSIECDKIFNNLNAIKECHVLTHAINLGKGRALKTGFNYFLNHFPNYKGVITVDGDGQHTAIDAFRLAEQLEAFPNHLILGVRDFNSDDVPLKSKLGNKITRFVLKILVNINVQDTQTGLRGISTQFIKQLLKVAGECYEYETNMLLESKKEEIPIKEVIIETVYIDNNTASHFNPFIDSIKIYGLILKFTSVSFASFILDISVFFLLINFLFKENYFYGLFIATFAARIVSSIFNYKCNKSFVFKCSGKGSHTVIKYYSLCVIQVVLSWVFLEIAFYLTKGNVTMLKVFIDFLLYMISFQVQRDYVFLKTEVQ